MSGQSRRIDSWKEIAEYLHRDVRTATRWESLGLPLHRVPGGKGRSVFAFTDEIDAWMASRPQEVAPTAAADLAPGPVEPVAAPAPSRTWRNATIVTALGLGGIVIAVLLASRSDLTALDRPGLQISATETHVSITETSGELRIIHRLEPGAVLVTRSPARIEDLEGDGTREAMVAVAYYESDAGKSIRPGELLNISAAGDVRWTFAFDDVITFGGEAKSGPWVMADWQAAPAGGRARVAISAHESTWWASMVAVLDEDGRRLGTFVNPGWIESVWWLSADRLAIAGFNNLRDEAMFAVLDVNNMNGQAPGGVGTSFACDTCGSAVPVFSAAFARTEVNRVMAGGFTRARVSPSDDRLVVTTVENARSGGDAVALYEFDSDLRFLRVRHSGNYWDEHRRLEIEGRITHTREQCPEREGPAAIHVWTAGRGWTKTVPEGS